MRHLSHDELIDLAEGMRTDASAPHLSNCEACRRQLLELRAVLASAGEVDVPEPSPLFWDHLSARVRAAVEAEGVPAPAPFWRHLFRPWSIGVFAGAFAVTVLMVAVGWWTMASRPIGGPATPGVAVADVSRSDHPVDITHDTLDAADDVSLRVVSDLMDLDAASGAGLADDGSAEHAVVHLTGSELRELRRLLQTELGGRGA